MSNPNECRDDDLSAFCEDCGVDTLPCPCCTEAKAQWYMVRLPVWQAAKLGAGFLCLGCLEARLGRKLEPNDLINAPINSPGVFDDTPRLRALKERFRDLDVL